jgi:hypothetical protein
VLSHGNAGDPGSHADLALALADAGFVVAAPMQAGDNYLDQSAAGTSRWLGDRNRHVRAASNTALVSAALGARAELHSVPGAGQTSEPARGRTPQPRRNVTFFISGFGRRRHGGSTLRPARHEREFSS